MAFSNGSGLDDDSEVMSEINMIPLVDVMLVLLIIFIITVPVLTHSVKLDLPRADNTPNEIKPQTITLAVTSDAQFHWNEDTVTMGELEARLAEIASQEPQPEVHIRGDRKVEYEYVLKLMAAVQRSGMLKVGFVSEPE
ncbi:MAG: biopolymer transporter ExbD [Porticoccaceae bacterium]|nr:biopolymer transporter ExbD [Porticoccaceae bacterium]